VGSWSLFDTAVLNRTSYSDRGLCLLFIIVAESLLIKMTNHKLKELDVDSPSDTGGWAVFLINDEVHSFQEVIMLLMAITLCDQPEAATETWEVHHYGKAAVHFGSEKLCKGMAELFVAAGLNAEAAKEWPDE